MTLIVEPKDFVSKASLKLALDQGDVFIQDPSIFGVNQSGWSTAKPVGFKGVVTNHPKRTKFAEIEKTANGWKVK